jgi:glycerol-3-phosphate acyltransferase PlsX
LYAKAAGFLAQPVLKAVIKDFDPDQYNGATFVGLQGIVIKSHGGAKLKAFAHAIEEAIVQVESDITQRIFIKIEELLKSSNH